MSAASNALRFRFRPRYKLFAVGMVVLGALFAAAPWTVGFAGSSRTIALICGCTAFALGLLYLVSPAWRLEVVVDDDALEVLSSGDRKFRLAWPDVVRVVASPDTKTCFVDGGEPELSLTVPGPGAPAPYDIERRRDLYDAIIARVDSALVHEVELLAGAQLELETRADEPDTRADEPDSDA